MPDFGFRGCVGLLRLEVAGPPRSVVQLVRFQARIFAYCGTCLILVYVESRRCRASP